MKPYTLNQFREIFASQLEKHDEPCLAEMVRCGAVGCGATLAAMVQLYNELTGEKLEPRPKNLDAPVTRGELLIALERTRASLNDSVGADRPDVFLSKLREFLR